MGRRRAAVLVLLVVCAVCVALVPRVEAGSREVTSRDDVADAARVVMDVMRLVSDAFVKELSVSTLIEGAVAGLVKATGDPHSAYLPPQSVEAFVESVTGVFEGIGVSIEMKDGWPTVVAPLPGSPAEVAGILGGDRIVQVDGRDINGASLDEVAKLVRGPAGSTVRVVVERPSLGKRLEFVLQRARIEIPAVEWRELGQGIGYVRVTQFSSGSARSFVQAIDALRQLDSLDALVLDLRNNPGGLLDEATLVAGCLVPKGPVALLIQRLPGERVLRVDGEPVGVPIAVLVNGGTASAAEVVAGAVRDRGAGVLVGARTFGKGTVQALYGLQNGGAVRLTVAAYLTPNGRYIEGRGLEPDIVVPSEVPGGGAGLPTFEWKRPLRVLTVGLDVLALQETLNSLGFDCGAPDGIYGSKTADAVRRFQRSRGLPPTGVVDKATADRLLGRGETRTDECLEKAREWLLSELKKRDVATGTR